MIGEGEQSVGRVEKARRCDTRLTERSEEPAVWLPLILGDGRESGLGSASRTCFEGCQAVATCLENAVEGLQSSDLDS